MHGAAPPPLLAWQGFYVIVGSSAAALIGLQFVVIALLAGHRGRATWREIDAFATPTIRHFGAALLLSAMLSAPWPSLGSAGIALAVCGGTGVVYMAFVFRRARAQMTYQLVFEDWLWHMALPGLAYASLAGSALTLLRDTRISLFVMAGTTLLLVFIGIHNAWDTITYIVLDVPETRDPAAAMTEASPPGHDGSSGGP